MNGEQKKFTYNYTAATKDERKAAARIREGYLPKEKAKKEKGAYLPTAAAIMLGAIGTLVFGGGFALILERGVFGLGSALCVAGMVLVGAAYPVHFQLSKRKKERKDSDLTKH